MSSRDISPFIYLYLPSLWHNACYTVDAPYAAPVELKTCKMRLLSRRASSKWIIGQPFSNLDAHTNHLEMLKCRFWSNWLGGNLRHSAFLTGPQVKLMLWFMAHQSATLRVERPSKATKHGSLVDQFYYTRENVFVLCRSASNWEDKRWFMPLTRLVS